MIRYWYAAENAIVNIRGSNGSNSNSNSEPRWDSRRCQQDTDAKQSQAIVSDLPVEDDISKKYRAIALKLENERDPARVEVALIAKICSCDKRCQMKQQSMRTARTAGKLGSVQEHVNQTSDNSNSNRNSKSRICNCGCHRFNYPQEKKKKRKTRRQRRRMTREEMRTK